MNKYMLIDDDDFFIFMTKRVLEKTGVANGIQTFLSAKAALAWLQENADRTELWPEVILLDIRMPFMNGFEFLEQLTKLSATAASKIRVYMLTSSVNEEDKEKARKYALVRDYYTKPLSSDVVMKIHNSMAS